MVFFFFKQKTAYEMRISDWSSDVCSSDLVGPPQPVDLRVGRARVQVPVARRAPDDPVEPRRNFGVAVTNHALGDLDQFARQAQRPRGRREHLLAEQGRAPTARSEEHTSELQSLMRISYAVFCLKKKKQQTK